MRARSRLLLAPILVLVAGVGAAQGDEPTAGAEPAAPHEAGLTEGQTRSLAVRYERARHWALRGFVLLALGERWHPAGVELVLEALRSKERALRLYGVACLRRTDPAALRTIATAELVEELVEEQVRDRHAGYAAEVDEVLRRLFPEAEVDAPAGWSRVWRAAEDGWALEPWIPPPPPSGDGRTSAMRGVDRALDLQEAGLDLCLCIDTTGSMQPTIDAVRDSIDDLVVLLQGIAPDLRLGLVEYKDPVDFSRAARVLEELTTSPDRVKKKLSRIEASGGGDFPEAVAAGLREAYGKEVEWKRHTNKLVVVFGDAPPKDTDAALALAREALARPFGLEPTDLAAAGRGRTRSVVRPFVTSAVGVGAEQVVRSTEKAFMRLAQAGGGAYATLLTEPPEGAQAPSEAIARHVLTLAFGAQWRGQVQAFVGVYMGAHRSGYLR